MAADHEWLDLAAGPVVRPYAMTGGRVRTGSELDLVAFVITTDERREHDDPQPEHRSILRHARLPVSVAELASRLDLPVGVIRVLLADLMQAGLITLHAPTINYSVDDDVLEAVLNGLRAL